MFALYHTGVIVLLWCLAHQASTLSLLTFHVGKTRHNGTSRRRSCSEGRRRRWRWRWRRRRRYHPETTLIHAVHPHDSCSKNRPGTTVQRRCYCDIETCKYRQDRPLPCGGHKAKYPPPPPLPSPLKIDRLPHPWRPTAAPRGSVRVGREKVGWRREKFLSIAAEGELPRTRGSSKGGRSRSWRDNPEPQNVLDARECDEFEE